MATTVASGFTVFLDRLKLTSSQESEAEDRRDSLIKFFADTFHMHETASSIGSFQRRTLIRPQRDVDILAPLSSTYWETIKNDSATFLYWVRDKLNSGYASTRVSTRRLSIKVAFSSIDVDVVPGFKRPGEGYYMPDGRGGWQNTYPQFHSGLMAGANTRHDLNLKPVVKLMKAWNLDNGNHLSSFHIELMTEKAWRGRSIGSWSSAVAGTLTSLAGQVPYGFPDPWTPGVSIDGYLTTAERDQARRNLEGDAKRAAEAEALRLAGREADAYGRWQVVYRSFPAWG